MYRFANVPLVLLCVVVGCSGMVYIAPHWSRTVGVDFWNYDEEMALFRNAVTEEQEIAIHRQRMDRQMEMTEHIAASLCESRITLSEAIAAVSTIARANPEWLALLRFVYLKKYEIPPTATDRDVLTHYLLEKIKAMRSAAEQVGDLTRAGVISARLFNLNEELRVHARGPSTINSSR